MTPIKNINWQPENLHDNLIELVPLAAADFDTLFEVASDPLIWEQHPSKDRYKKEVFQQYFDEGIASGTAFLIVDIATNKIIGCTRYYQYNPDNSSIAIGYTFLSKESWGGQYNKSAKKLLLDYAFQFVDTVYFHIGATNTRSQLATMKIGARKVNEMEIPHNGNNVLHFEYEIRKTDWLY